MLTAICLVWLGIGSWLRARAIGHHGGRLPLRMRVWQWTTRAFGVLALATAVRVATLTQGALAPVAVLMAVMAASSIAVVAAALWPRVFALTLPLTAAGALLSFVVP
jgi:hypothetical protein